MIYGKLGTQSTYAPIVGRPLWDEVIDTLSSLHTDTPLGITNLRPDGMLLNVHSYQTKPADTCRFEGHRNTIDVQYIIDGGECIDWALKETLTEDGDYLIERDFQYYQAPTSGNPTIVNLTRLHLYAGYFCIMFPEDGHRPKISDQIHPGVKKAVIKIKDFLLE